MALSVGPQLDSISPEMGTLVIAPQGLPTAQHIGRVEQPLLSDRVLRASKAYISGIGSMAIIERQELCLAQNKENNPMFAPISMTIPLAGGTIMWWLM